jgi:AhpD family alkylhydroperoxidase
MANLINYVTIVSPKAARGVVGEVYGQVKREIGRLVEAVTMFSPDTEVLVSSWAAFREPLLASGRASRMSKEAVAATVSRLNECPYCVDAHTIMLYGGGAGNFATQLLGGLSAGQLDTEFRDLSRWAEETSCADTATATPPFAADRAPELIGVLVYFHFLNRMINVVLTGTFLPGPPGAKKVARRVGGRVMKRNITAKLEPGRAPGLTGGLPLPADLSWAAPSAPIADAFAMLASATETAVRRSTSPAVREAVERAIAAWRGGSPGVGASWVREPMSGLPDEDRPAARLALLSALAPYQVTEQDVLAFRAAHPSDAELVGLLSWSTFLAARRIGAWTAEAIARRANRSDRVGDVAQNNPGS